MKIHLSSITVGKYNGGHSNTLNHLKNYIESELKKNKFKSSFEGFWLTLSYPPLCVKSGIRSTINEFQKSYDDLPYSRINRRKKEINVTLKAPEFSEYFNKQENTENADELEIKNLNEVELAKILIDKFIEAGEIIRSKLKKEDIFDYALYKCTLLEIKQAISSDLLSSINPVKGLLR